MPGRCVPTIHCVAPQSALAHRILALTPYTIKQTLGLPDRAGAPARAADRLLYLSAGGQHELCHFGRPQTVSTGSITFLRNRAFSPRVMKPVDVKRSGAGLRKRGRRQAFEPPETPSRPATFTHFFQSSAASCRCCWISLPNAPSASSAAAACQARRALAGRDVRASSRARRT